jgi:hypothetical protein
MVGDEPYIDVQTRLMEKRRLIQSEKRPKRRLSPEVRPRLRDKRPVHERSFSPEETQTPTMSNHAIMSPAPPVFSDLPTYPFVPMMPPNMMYYPSMTAYPYYYQYQGYLPEGPQQIVPQTMPHQHDPRAYPFHLSPMNSHANDSPSQANMEVTVPPTKSHNHSFHTKHCRNVQLVGLAISALELSASTMDWLLTDWFFTGPQFMLNLINKRFLERGQWIAFPLFTAGVILASFPPKTGVLSDEVEFEGRVVSVDVEKLRDLFMAVKSCVELVVETAALQTPSHDPMVPINVFLEAVVSLEHLHNAYSHAHTEDLWTTFQLVLHIVTRWQLLRMDLYDPKISHETPPNGWIAALWKSDDVFPGSIMQWRTLARKVGWQVLSTDVVYSGIFDEYPHIQPSDVAFLNVPVPDRVYANVKDTSDWDYYYTDLNGHSVKNLSWMLLPRGDERRVVGLQVLVGNLKETGAGMLNCATFILHAGVLECTMEPPRNLNGTDPFLEKNSQHVEQCPSLMVDPVKFWMEMIDDIFDMTEEPLKAFMIGGRYLDMWRTVSAYWGPFIASRYFIFLMRLFDARLRLSAWTPQMSLTEIGKELARRVKYRACRLLVKGEKRGFGHVVPIQSFHTFHSRLQLTEGEDWFRVFSHASMESVLEDAICSVELMKIMTMALQDLHNVRVGHSILSIATRLAMIQISILAAIKNEPDTMKSAFNGNAPLEMIRAVNRMTSGPGVVSPWILRLDKMSSGLTPPSTQAVADFYQSFTEV